MKKKPEEMIALKTKFIKGGEKNGYPKDDLEELFNQIEGFSSYGFNKSHRIVCHSIVI